MLPLPGRLELKVASLAGARVKATARLTDVNGKPHRYAWQPDRTDFELDSGSLRLLLAPGTWKLDVRAEDGRTWSGTATVVPGATAQVTLD